MFRDLRRSRQALSPEECGEILCHGTSGVLALAGDDGYPYAVPLSYVYAGGKLYFHCAKAGHKLDAIARNPKGSFCVIHQDQVVPETYTTHYRTVIAFGKEDAHAARFAQKNRRYTAGKCLYYKLEAVFYETLQAYPQLLRTLVVIFGSLFITGGSLSAATLVTFLLYAGTLSEPIHTLLNFLNLFEQGKASFIRFMAPSAKTSATAAKTPPTPRSSRPPSWPGCMRSSLRSRTAMTAWWAQRGLCCPAGSGSG